MNLMLPASVLTLLVSAEPLLSQPWHTRKYNDTEVVTRSSPQSSHQLDDAAALFPYLGPPTTRVRLSSLTSGDWRKLCGLSTFDGAYSYWRAGREALTEFRGMIAERIEVKGSATVRVFENGRFWTRNERTSQNLFEFGSSGQYRLVYASSWCGLSLDSLRLYFHSRSQVDLSAAETLCAAVKEVIADTPSTIRLRQDFSFGSDPFYPLWTPFEGSALPALTSAGEWRAPSAECHISRKECSCSLSARR